MHVGPGNIVRVTHRPAGTETIVTGITMPRVFGMLRATDLAEDRSFLADLTVMFNLRSELAEEISEGVLTGCR
jgi:hypothetical protein